MGRAEVRTCGEAYELVEQPQIRSARTYNIIVGHLVGLGAGFLSVYLLHAQDLPNAFAMGGPSAKRVWAIAIVAALTTSVNLLLKAGQPAALATTLIVALGSMQTRHDAIAIVLGVLIIAGIGEPIRRFRLKYTQTQPVTGDA